MFPSGPESPKRKNSGAVGALLGAIAGLIVFVAFADRVDPILMRGVVRYNQPGAQSEITIELFGREVYSRASLDPDTIAIELGLWSVIPGLLCILIGVCFGGYVGLRLELLLRRTPNVPTKIADLAADYDEMR